MEVGEEFLKLIRLMEASVMVSVSVDLGLQDGQQC